MQDSCCFTDQALVVLFDHEQELVINLRIHRLPEMVEQVPRV